MLPVGLGGGSHVHVDRVSRALTFVAALALLAGCVIARATPAYAVTTIVQCPTDDLSAAIAAAAPGDTLVIGGTCTGNFVVGQNLTLSGATGATLDGGGSATVLTIDAPAKVKVIRLTITGGTGTGLCDGFISGGGICNGGTLTVSHSILSGNSATGEGGGIYNSGTLTFSNSTLTGNSADSGGGSFNDFGGTLTVSNSILSGNSASGNGGAIFNYGTLTIWNSTLSGNSASYGAGIAQLAGPLDLTNSTLSGNTASSYGGGVYQPGGFLNVTNSTVSGNSAGAVGGGFYNAFASSQITNSTVANNSATVGGGIDTIGGLFFVTGSIIADSPLGYDCDGDLIYDFGSNLDSDSSCVLYSATSLSGVDPLLGPLQNNGGKTATMALAPTSPAVDAAPCVSGGEDQRGTVRPQGSACDIGAFELKAPWIAAVTVDSGVSGGSPSVSGTITCNLGGSFAVSVTLKQGRTKALGSSSTAACDGPTPVAWTASVAPGTFTRGAAKVSYKATNGAAKKRGKVSVVLT